MRKFISSLSLLTLIGSFLLSVGCASSGGLTSAPVFPNSNLDYSSHLDSMQAPSGGSPYIPQGGFGDRPARGPLFSMGSRGPSGSC